MKAVLALLLLAATAARAQSVCQTYVVAPGDNVGMIATRFGVTEADLQAALTSCINGYTPGVFLQPNQKICLPPFYPACANVRIAGGEGSGFDQCKYYIVQAGDTLENIALSLGLNRLDLDTLNPEANMLQVNDFVKLPGWYAGCPPPGDTQPCRYYVAEAADSLSSIAIAFSVDLTDLQSVNPTLAGDTNVVLQPGQQIFIPPFDTVSCGGGVQVSKPNIGSCNAYVVLAGDTLYSVAAAFQTTTQQLLDVNPALAAGGVLSPGTEVFIPPYKAEDCAAGINYVTPTYAYYPSPSPAAVASPAPVTASPSPAAVASPAPVTASPSPAAVASPAPVVGISPPAAAAIQEDDEAAAPAPAGEGAPEGPEEVEAPTPAPAPAPEAATSLRRRLMRSA